MVSRTAVHEVNDACSVAVLLDALRVGRVRDLSEELSARIEVLNVFEQVFLLDAGSRFGSFSVDEIQASAVVIDAQDPPLNARMWLTTVLAEAHLWRGSLDGVLTAQVALTEAAGPLGDPVALMARARLRRLISFAMIFIEPEDSDASLLLRDQAIVDLDAAGMTDERSLTRAMYAALRVMRESREAETFLPQLRQEVDALADLRSDRAALGWFWLGWAGMFAYEWETVSESLAALTRMPEDVIWPALWHLVELLRATERLHLGGLDPEISERLRKVFDAGREALLDFSFARLFVVAVLLDKGHPAEAREILAGVSPNDVSGTPLTRRYYEENRLRLATQQGDANSLDRLADVTKLWIAEGRNRYAGRLCLRMARDAERAGRPDAGAWQRRRGVLLLPTDQAQWTPFEREIVGLVEVEPVVATSELLLFGPDLVVRRGGHDIAIPPLLARMLVLLAVRQRPATTDWLIDRLWPDADIDTGQNRLKVDLHRLRRRLDLEVGELVVRDRAGISLTSDDRWYIDLWEWRRLSRGNNGQRLRALEMFGGDLCSRQFSYDDLVIEEALHLRTRWSTIARSLLQTAWLSPQRAVELTLGGQAATHDFASELAQELRPVDRDLSDLLVGHAATLQTET